MIVEEPTVADVYLEKAKASETLGCCPPTELTMHPFRWGKFEAEIQELKGEVKRETRTIDHESRIVLEDLLVCLDMNFPVDVILVS